jgi:hypothetical protein
MHAFPKRPVGNEVEWVEESLPQLWETPLDMREI